MIRVGLYARVSTDDQNTEVQLRDMRSACSAKSWNIVDSYIDQGISGTKARRPELDRLMADAQAKKFDVVMVARFDRFARSVPHLLRALETFNSLNIQFVSLAEQIDTSTPAGRMVFIVMGAVSELERSLIVERVNAGLRNARANGVKLGRKLNSTTVSKETVVETVAKCGSLRAAAQILGLSYKTAWNIRNGKRG